MIFQMSESAVMAVLTDKPATWVIVTVPVAVFLAATAVSAVVTYKLRRKKNSEKNKSSAEKK